jgi:histidinol-phosphatase (PHP family)
MLLDYHLHPDYSIDAGGSMREYAQAALEKGLGEICFTTHLDLVPERMHLDGFVRICGKFLSVNDRWIPHYLREIEGLRKEYEEKGLVIKAGVEIDYHPKIVGEIRAIVEEYPFDYVLGAVHSLEGHSIAIPEDCRAFCRGRTAEEVCRQYFSLVIEAIQCGLFDTIAHLDLYKRFSYSIYGHAIEQAHLLVWEQVLSAFSSSNVGIEINTGNWRKGLSQPSPSSDQLIDLIGAGVATVTVGSDAHLPHLVGKDITKAIEFARKAGCLQIHTYSKRRPAVALLLDKEHKAAE